MSTELRYLKLTNKAYFDKQQSCNHVLNLCFNLTNERSHQNVLNQKQNTVSNYLLTGDKLKGCKSNKLDLSNNSEQKGDYGMKSTVLQEIETNDSRYESR